MNASRYVSLLLVLLAGVAFAATSHLPKANTRHDVQAYVEDAAKLVRKSGPSCAAFASPEWRGGPYYIFVDGPNSIVVCHLNAALVGKLSTSVVNLKGERVGEMVAAMGRGNGKGWVQYMWTPPGKKAEEMKSTYVMGVTGPDGKHYVVGAGGWNLK